MKKNLLIIVILIIASGTSSFAQLSVGHISTTFVDSSRTNRNITAEIYYPSDSPGDNVAIATGQYPVLIFGHGFIITWSAYEYLWNAIVPKGYIMVFPTTETSILPSHPNLAQDMAYLVEAMKRAGVDTSSAFNNSVDNKSAVLGHSMGGGCSFLAIQYDSSITAMATLAAAETNPSAIAAAANVTIPTIVFSGANDCIAATATNQTPMYDSLSSYCKSYVSITGASHCQFAGANGACSLGELFCSPSAAISDSLQHSTTLDLLIPWLDFYLKSSCSAGTQFQSLIAGGSGITSAQNCFLTCTGVQENNTGNSFSVFPNPASSVTEVKFSNSLNSGTLIVMNTLGEKVYEMNNINDNQLEINIENFQNGLYIIQIENNNVIYSKQKLIINR